MWSYVHKCSIDIEYMNLICICGLSVYAESILSVFKQSSVQLCRLAAGRGTLIPQEG